MDADDLAAALGTEAANELHSALERITHCVDQLSDDQIWLRPDPSMNSIGNLILHLAGNVRQWLVAGLGNTPDVRNRPAEFAERGPIPKADLLRQLRAAVNEAAELLRKQRAQALMKVRRIQGASITGLQAIFNSVPHFRGHTQEIIHMTRTQLGDAYRIAWEPRTPEEGAPD